MGTQVNVIQNDNQLTVNSVYNTITVIDNNREGHIVEVIQPISNVITVTTGPAGNRGPIGPAGPTGSSQPFTAKGGDVWFTTSSIEITGSFTISGSNTFKNIGPAIFSGSISTSGSVFIDGNLIITGTASFYSSSIVYSSGSTKFGDTLDDTHQFTGSILVTGSLNSPAITGSLTGSVTGSLLGTASFSLQTATASYILPLTQSVFISGSIFQTGSVSIQPATVTGQGIVLRELVNVPTYGALYIGVVPSSTNFTIASEGANPSFNGATTLALQIANSTKFLLNSTTATLSTNLRVTGSVFHTGSHYQTGSLKVYATGSDFINLGNATPNPSSNLGILRIGQHTSVIDMGYIAGSQAAIWVQKTTPSTTNYTITADAATTIFNGVDNLIFSTAATERFRVNRPQTSGVLSTFTWASVSDTGMTAGTNIPKYIFNGGSTQWLAGNLTNQYFYHFRGGTASFASGNNTITDVYNIYVGSTNIGTGATASANWAAGFEGNVNITTATPLLQLVSNANGIGCSFRNTAWSMNRNVNTGTIYNSSAHAYQFNHAQSADGVFDSLKLQVYTPAGGAVTSASIGVNGHGELVFIPGNTISRSSSIEYPSARFSNFTRQWLVGDLTIQRERLFSAPTYSFSNSSTITSSYNIYAIAPLMSTSATASRNFAAGFEGGIEVIGNSYQTGSIIISGSLNTTGSLNVTGSSKLAGKVLISNDVVTPSNLLTIGDSDSSTTQLSSAFLNIFNSSATTNNYANIAFGQSGAGSNSFSRFGVQYVDRTGGSEDQDFIWGTVSAGSYSEKMRFTSVGNLIITGSTNLISIHNTSGSSLRICDWAGSTTTYGYGIVSNHDSFKLPTTVYFGDSSYYVNKFLVNGSMHGGAFNTFRDFKAVSGNSNRIFIYGEDSTGNVGIGTTSPSHSLDVSGSGRFRANLYTTGSVNISGSLNLTGSAVINRPNDASLTVRATSFNNGGFDVGADNGGIHIGTSAADNWTLRHANVNKVFISSSNISFNIPIIVTGSTVLSGSGYSLTNIGSSSFSGSIEVLVPTASVNTTPYYRLYTPYNGGSSIFTINSAGGGTSGDVVVGGSAGSHQFRLIGNSATQMIIDAGFGGVDNDTYLHFYRNFSTRWAIGKTSTNTFVIRNAATGSTIMSVDYTTGLTTFLSGSTVTGSLNTTTGVSFGTTNTLVYTSNTNNTLVNTGATSAQISTVSGTRTINIQSYAADANYIDSVGVLRIRTTGASEVAFWTDAIKRASFASTGEFTISENTIISSSSGNALSITGSLSVSGSTRLRGNLIQTGSTYITGSLTITGSASYNNNTIATLPDVRFCVQMGSISFNPADATTYYDGMFIPNNSNHSQGAGKIYIPQNCTLIGYSLTLYNNGGVGTNETSSISCSINNSTLVTLDNVMDVTKFPYTSSASNLNTNINAGDYVELRWTTPTWGTNPVSTAIAATLWFKGR